MDKIKEIFSKNGKYIILGLLVILLILLLILFFLRADDSDVDRPDDPQVPVQPVDPSDPSDPEDPSTPELVLVEQPLDYSDEYVINIPQNIVQEIDEIEQRHPSFEVLVSDYVTEIESLLKAMGKDRLEYNKEAHTADFVLHNWRSGNDLVTYNVSRDFLSMEFDDAVSITDVNFNPRDKDSLEESIRNFAHRYFSEDFEYRVDEVTTEGLLHRVSFRRELDGFPVDSEIVEEYILLTRDGKIKSGVFLLADFAEIPGSYPLISGSELSRSINLLEYPKTINFYFSEPQDDIDYHTIITEGVSRGNINIDNLELVYYYSDRQQQALVPTFLFQGHGTVVITRRTIESEFVIFASALEPDYVYLPPDSYFELLRSN